MLFYKLWPSNHTNQVKVDFALTEAAFAIVRILQRYPNIRLPANEKAGLVGTELQKVTLVLQIAGGCKVDLG